MANRDRLSDRELQKLSDELAAAGAAANGLRGGLSEARFDLVNSRTAEDIGTDAGFDVEKAQEQLQHAIFMLGEARKKIESLRKIEDGDDKELQRYRKRRR